MNNPYSNEWLDIIYFAEMDCASGVEFLSRLAVLFYTKRTPFLQSPFRENKRMSLGLDLWSVRVLVHLNTMLFFYLYWFTNQKGWTLKLD